MKKLLALLLVAVMCFSLAACGAKTQEVEITMDNWNEYFELTNGAEWVADDFGDTKEAWLYACFCVKEEYTDRILLDKSDLTVEVCEYWTLASLDYDLENKTISNIKYFEPASEGILIGERTNYSTFNLDNAETHSVEDIVLQESNGKIIHHIMDTNIPNDMYDGVDNQKGYAMCEYSVSRIQGTIVVKEAK